MTCKDCIHSDVCEIKNYPMLPKAEKCKDFQNKANVKEALEKQMPKKVDIVYAPSVGRVADLCPSCGFDCFGDNQDKYCMNCGQALDWSDDK